MLSIRRGWILTYFISCWPPDLNASGPWRKDANRSPGPLLSAGGARSVYQSNKTESVSGSTASASAAVQMSHRNVIRVPNLSSLAHARRPDVEEGRYVPPLYTRPSGQFLVCGRRSQRLHWVRMASQRRHA